MVELQVLPAIRGQARILNLDGRKLQRVPPSVAKLNLLTSLRLQNNRIAKLPPELAGLSNLTELHLGNNVFEEVPEELKNFRSLQKLFMFGNKITTISTKIFDGLENLIILNLNNNKIKYIPPEIHRLSNLQHLTLNETMQNEKLKIVRRSREPNSNFPGWNRGSSTNGVLL
ncbi:leucine-rich repeat-containing protein 69 isoform X4 [Rhinatrema bivittatum]|uniref:leucine-rich repeat-containing protein 69 isoform X4 n=1 Tax=Rhinatrema bivittatum TaxID=194408 RepID=UPI001128A3B5|nr:leucine-rich repeat-containing protein 69 isoform X4 [Rhinatrema bivittatum]